MVHFGDKTLEDMVLVGYPVRCQSMSIPQSCVADDRKTNTKRYAYTYIYTFIYTQDVHELTSGMKSPSDLSLPAPNIFER